jgi:predicted nucleic acid-binding protein
VACRWRAPTPSCSLPRTPPRPQARRTSAYGADRSASQRVDEHCDAETAGALGRQYLRTHPGIDTVDLIVAAVTQHLDAELKTTNLKHFPMFPKLEAPY